MGQGTSECGVGSNHRGRLSANRQPKYPQSSPLTEMYEQGAWPWLKKQQNWLTHSMAERILRFAQDFGSGLPLTLKPAIASSWGY